MSTSYSIYRFAKPTKYELAGIDYFSEHGTFYFSDYLKSRNAAY